MSARRAGSCFGFSVIADTPLLYLRDGAGGQTLRVEERPPEDPPPRDELTPVLHWVPPTAPLDARLYGNAESWRLWVAGSGWFGVDPVRGVIVLPHGEEPVRREERLWGIPSALSFAARGDAPLHAAAVEVGDSAVVIAAPGRFGKTTLAAGFAQGGYRVLSEDLTCLRLDPVPVVVPGPAMLRLRKDVASLFDLSWGCVVGEQDDRVHIAFADQLRGTGEPVRVAALVFVRWAQSPPRLERQTSMSALSDLWALSFHLPSSEGRRKCFESLTQLLERVPVFDLWRRPTFEDMKRSVDLISSLRQTAAKRQREPAA